MTEQKLTLYTGDGEWSALYVDGKLHTIGDHYLCEDAVMVLCEVTTVESNDFLLGGDGREAVAQTLEGMALYTKEREARELLADQLLTESARLQERAEKLRAGEDV